MKDYSKLTDEELNEELAKLEESMEQNLIMDGSGELGGKISEGYDAYFNAIYLELNKRGLVPEVDDYDNVYDEEDEMLL